ncbi:MAG: hypothetical protein OXT49_09010 [Gammaproteobacteria bacterium]|nr:hypothetical protein [Gammaproteobacteria bacterium]
MTIESLLYSFCALFFSGCESPHLAEPLSATQTSQGQQLIQLNTDLVDEASGLSASSYDNILWMHNDSGSEAEIHAVNTATGDVVQTVSLTNAESNDWEDMARFQRNGKLWLLVADVGDNRAVRSNVTLYALPEPKLEQATASVKTTINFRYEDGARDSEAVAVDSEDNTVWLLTKRDTPPRLYKLALQETTDIATAEFVTEVTTIPEPTAEDIEEDPYYGELRSQPTAMSISADGTQLMVTTYKDSYLYQQHQNGWGAALQQKPTLIDIPQMAQTEAGGFSKNGKAVWVASEQLPTQLFHSPLPELPAKTY